MKLRRVILQSAIWTTYYPSLWVSRALCAVGRWNWWDEVDETIILGAVPSRKDLRTLHHMGVRGVVNLCAEFGGHRAEMENLGITQLHLPTLDYFSPSEQDLIQGIEFIRLVAGLGQRVYLHCKAGRGRSATLAICHVMAARRCGAEEAFEIVRRARHQIDGRLRNRAVLRLLEPKLVTGRPISFG